MTTSCLVPTTSTPQLLANPNFRSYAMHRETQTRAREGRALTRFFAVLLRSLAAWQS